MKCNTCNKDVIKKDYFPASSQKFNSNLICKVCFIDSISSGFPLADKCSECVAFKRKSVYSTRSKSTRLLSHRNTLDAMDSLYSKFCKNVDSVKKNSNSSIENLSSYSHQLKSILNDEISNNIKTLNAYQEKVKKNMQMIREEIKKSLHKVRPSLATRSGQILNCLINFEDLRKTEIIKREFEVFGIEELVKSSIEQKFLPIEKIFIDQSIGFYSTSKPGVLMKFNLGLENIEEVNITGDYKGFKWPACASYIEFNNESIFLCGGAGRLTQIGKCWIVTKFDSSIFQMSECTSRKNHSLEYYNLCIYSFGGTTQIYEKLDFSTQNWKKSEKLMPEEYGTTHSVNKGNYALLAGKNSKTILKYIFSDDTFQNINSNFYKKKNKLIFSNDDEVYIFYQSSIYHSKLDLCTWSIIKTDIKTKLKRCPGKGKLFNSFLYFVTQDDIIWRFCTITYEIKVFKVT